MQCKLLLDFKARAAVRSDLKLVAGQAELNAAEEYSDDGRALGSGLAGEAPARLVEVRSKKQTPKEKLSKKKWPAGRGTAEKGAVN